ncbi:STAS domain-containing protein [Streptomyces coelicoflavus]|uniref:STAS domain-containing protein n=1 Tax=Streptomyces coelicoflavus TaxID=285562 RepID=UPI003629C23D
MNSALRVVTADTRGRTTALALTGELDLNTAPLLYSTVKNALGTHRTAILDMPGVTFCDSSGLNTLIRLHHQAQDAGSRLILAAPPRQMLRLLTITGVRGILPVYGSLAEAWQAHPAHGAPPVH